MKKAVALFLTLILFSSFTLKEHETYLSVTEIEYRPQKETLQIISRVFIDDMEDVLSKRYQKDVSLSYKKDLEINKDLLQKYISKKFTIEIDNKAVQLNLLGSKFDADQIVLFLEATNIKKFGSIEVENLILTDLYDSQKNIVHVKKGDAIESMLLVKDKSSSTVNF